MGNGRVSRRRRKGNDGWLERADDRRRRRAAIGAEELDWPMKGWTTKEQREDGRKLLSDSEIK